MLVTVENWKVVHGRILSLSRHFGSCDCSVSLWEDGLFFWAVYLCVCLRTPMFCFSKIGKKQIHDLCYLYFYSKSCLFTCHGLLFKKYAATLTHQLTLGGSIRLHLSFSDLVWNSSEREALWIKTSASEFMTYPSILQLALCNYITTATGVVVNEGYLNIPKLKKFFVMSQIAEHYECRESMGGWNRNIQKDGSL